MSLDSYIVAKQPCPDLDWDSSLERMAGEINCLYGRRGKMNAKDYAVADHLRHWISLTAFKDSLDSPYVTKQPLKHKFMAAAEAKIKFTKQFEPISC